LTWLKS